MEEYNYFEFSADVSRSLHKKLIDHALKYTNEVDNTRTPSLERKHFFSTNITSILNRVFRSGTFTVSSVKYKIEDYDEIELGEEQLYKNRQAFLEEIENCDNILDFIFLTFRLQQ